MDPSSNSSRDTDDTEESQMWLHATSIALFVMLMFLIVVANALLLFVIRNVGDLKRSSRIFLASLTAADLLLGVITIPLRIVPQIVGFFTSSNSVAVPDGLCEVYLFFEIFSICASILAVLALTIERYLAVEMPLRFRSIVTSRRACLVVALSWTTSACTASACAGFALADKQFISFDESLSLCKMRTFRGVIRYLFISFVSVYFLVPLCVTFVASIRILYIVKKHTEFQESAPNPCTCCRRDGQAADAACSRHQHGMCSELCRGLCRCFMRNKNCLVTLLIITLSYSVTSLPYVVCVFYMEFSHDDTNALFYELASLMLYSSCFLNATVYSIRNRTFRASAKRLLQRLPPYACKRCTRRRKQAESQSVSSNVNISTENTHL